MSHDDESTQGGFLERPRTCKVRGKPGTFYLLKLCPQKARVIPTDMPGGKGFLVNKEDLREVEAAQPMLGLFPEVPEITPGSTEDPRNDEQPTSIIETATSLQPLPFGVLDLEPAIQTDPGPPLRVRCYVRDCTEMLRPPSRGFRGDSCRVHRVRCHLSGTNPTYTYCQAKRNIIASPDLFAQKLIGHPFKFESHRLGYEKSEDALTWNVFRSFQEAQALHLVAQLITGTEIAEEPLLYLWGIGLTNDSFEPSDLLIQARQRFESSLPVKRPATEPDICLFLERKYLILIEAKFTSPNTYYAEGPRKNQQSLTKQELINIYQDPVCQIIDIEKAKQAELVHYQLFRNVQFASFMAHLDSPTTQAFHANLVRSGYEHASTQHFSNLLRPEYADRFTRVTWEELFVLATLNRWRMSRLIEYMLCKTASLVPAFQLDVW